MHACCVPIHAAAGLASAASFFMARADGQRWEVDGSPYAFPAKETRASGEHVKAAKAAGYVFVKEHANQALAGKWCHAICKLPACIGLHGLACQNPRRLTTIVESGLHRRGPPPPGDVRAPACGACML